MTTRVKICGIKNIDDALFAVSAGADVIGIVHVEESKRFLDLREAGKIFRAMPPFVSKVIVASPKKIGEIREIERCGTDCIQLHGLEDVMLVKEIRDSTHLKLVLQLPVTGEETIDEASSYSGLVDAILLDTKTERGFGGTGVVHDWNVSRRIVETIKKPVILAGGLNSVNVLNAIEKVQPYAVDVASGAESSPGVKDKGKVLEFIKKVKCYGIT